MARNTTFIPATPPGEISKLIIATHDDDAAFQVLLTQQQAAINTAYMGGMTTIATMFTKPLEVPSGPHAILAVIHSSGAAEAQMVCIHSLRVYTLGSLTPVGTDPSLVSRAFGFVGEIIVEEGTTILPQCFQQPEEIEELSVPHPIRVPEVEALTAAFTAYDASAGATGMDELMSADTASVEAQLPKLLVIPTVLFPMFAAPQSPRATLQKMDAIVAAMPEDERHIFKRTIKFIRASCVKEGGVGGAQDTSRMRTMWTVAPASSALFRKWQRTTMRNLYVEAFSGANPTTNNAAAGMTSLFGAGAVEAFGVSFGTATNAAMEKLGDKLKEARAEERQETAAEKTKKSKWSELAQNRILRCHGYDALTVWDEQNVSEIWGMYQQAMREGTSPIAGIVETFASVFHREPSVLEGERPNLSISTTTAKCIKEGRLCPQPGLLRYENIDEGLLPLAFVRRESSEILEDTYQEEEYQRSNHRTIEGERLRSGRAKVKKAPDTYSDTIGLLRGYAEVLKEHFTTASAGFKETNRVFQCLCRRQDTWRDAWDGTIGARFWWLFSRAIHDWISPSEWGYGGVAPTMEVGPIINCISSGSFPMQVDMPVQLIKLTGRPPPAVTFGGMSEPIHNPPPPNAGSQTKTNPNVHPKFRTGIWPALEKFGGRSSLRSLMTNYGPAAGSQVKFASSIINDAQCQEFVVSGKCVDRRCQRKHDPSYTPAADHVDKFLAKVAPIVAYVLANDTAALERARKRMRTHA